MIAEVLGRDIRFEELTREQARAQLVSQGADADTAEWLLDVRADPEGMDHVSGDVEALLGRPALSYATWVADHADAFT